MSMSLPVMGFDIPFGADDDSWTVANQYGLWTKRFEPSAEKLRVVERIDGVVNDAPAAPQTMRLIPAGMQHRIAHLFGFWRASDADTLFFRSEQDDGTRYALVVSIGALNYKHEQMLWTCPDCQAELARSFRSEALRPTGVLGVCRRAHARVQRRCRGTNVQSMWSGASARAGMGYLRRASLLFGAAALVCIVPAAVAAEIPATLNVATTPGDTFAEAYYAVEQGLFRRAGLNVEVTTFAGRAALAAAVSGGSADFGVASPLGIAQAVARGAAFSIVAAGALNTAKDPSGLLVVAKNSPLRTARDFEGKTIAVNAIKSESGVASMRGSRKAAPTSARSISPSCRIPKCRQRFKMGSSRARC